MSTQDLLRDHNIAYVTEGNAHCTQGWINVHCPFCHGSRDYHMGIHEDSMACNCWRCGGHSITETFSKLLNLPPYQAKAIIQKYRGKKSIFKQIPEPKIAINPLKFPPHTPLKKSGYEYLNKRKFDPEKIEKEWKIKQTAPISLLDKIQYGRRILIPIEWKEEVVSFQARDITGTSHLKYLACPMNREKIHHKNIVYGDPKEKDTIIIVEGVTDVWRLGKNAFATFGTAFKMEQVMSLSKLGNRFFIIFDNESQAQKQAKKLTIKLKALGKQAYIETVDDDPGELLQADADNFVRYLLKNH